MNRSHWAVSAMCCASLITSATIVSRAGPLNPPAGPVASSYKTLVEVEPRTPISALPFTITQTGSYYLTSSLTGQAGSNGITVLASGVTLDLNGFGLFGVAGAGSGIAVGAVGNLEVRNGSIREWPVDGVNAIQSSNCRYQDLRMINCGHAAIRTGISTLVQRCNINSIGFNAAPGDPNPDTWAVGIQTGFASVVRDCVCDATTARGYNIGDGSVMESCASTRITASGADGYALVAGIGCVVRDSVFRGGTVAGVILGRGSHMSGCTVSFGPKGIIADTGCIISNNAIVDVDQAGVTILSTARSVTVDGNTMFGTGAIGSVGIVFSSDADIFTRNNIANFNSLFSTATPTSAGPSGSPPSFQTNPWANFSR